MAPQKGFIPQNKIEIDLEQMKRFYYASLTENTPRYTIENHSIIK